jgi:hypothetical protein
MAPGLPVQEAGWQQYDLGPISAEITYPCRALAPPGVADANQVLWAAS